MQNHSELEISEHLKNLEVYGYTQIPNFLSNDTVSQAIKIIDQNYRDVEKVEDVGRPARDRRDKLVYNLQNIDPFFIDLLVDPFVRSLLMANLNDPYYRFLPPEAPNYILGYYNARSSGLALDLHIDSQIPNPGDFTWAMQVVFVLDSMNEENGCTVVVPGSHRSGRFTDRELTNLKPIIANAGDLVIWDSRLWHGTMENNTGDSRWALIATMTQWWVKQSMDITRALPEHIYQNLSDEQKALLGFCSIPPVSQKDRVNTKCGYDFLKPSVTDYY